MKLYKTTGIIDIYGGYIGLSEEQSAARASKLKKRGKSYEILAPVQFKAGEVIKLQNPDKVLLAKLEEVL